MPTGQQTWRSTTFDWRNQPLQVNLNGTPVASYQYNFWGQPTQINDSNGFMQLQYDAAGNVSASRDATSGTPNYVTYTYDQANRRTQAQVYVSTRQGIAASLVSATFAYDLASELTSTTDRNSRRRDFTYDALGRATQELWFDISGTQVATITSSRDLLNNLTTITNATGTVSQTSDQFNRLLSSTDVWGIAVTYSYNAADQRTGMSDSKGGSATWAYDTSSGRLTQESVSQPSSSPAQIGYSYNNDNQVNRRTYSGTGTTITTDYGFEGAGQVNSIQVYTSTRKIETVTYSYDVNTGLVSGITRKAWRTEADPYVSLTYLPPLSPPATESYQTNSAFSSVATLTNDSRGQLTAFGSQGFSYDGNGNLAATGIQIGAGNRLLQDTVWNYQYDLEGNLIKKTKQSGSDIWDYSYDHLNRLTEAKETTVFAGTTYTLADVTYRYDGLGRRVESVRQAWTLTTYPTVVYTQVTNDTVHYSYDGSALLFDLNGSNAVQSRYVADANSGETMARLDTSGTQKLWWYVSDKQGAILDLLDTAGRAWKRLKEGGFKTDNTSVASGTQTGWVPNSDGTWSWSSWSTTDTLVDRLGFAGQELEVLTNLLYTGLRWYEQEQGRFLSEDPNGLAGTNAYRFPQNSPQNVKDIHNYWGEFWDKLGKGTVSWGTVLWSIADRLTAGLTRRVRRALDIDTVDYRSAEYGVGQDIGQGIQIAMTFTGGGAILNGVQAVGSVINGLEAFSENRIWDGVQSLAGAGLAVARSVSLCALTDGALKTAGYGLFAYGVASSVYSAVQKAEDGNVLGALLDLAEAGASIYRFMQACFAAGTPLLWEFGSKAIEKFAVGERVWSRDENDPYGPLVLKVIEEVFEGTAKILHVQVRDQVIRTTMEHPFFVKRAWAFVAACGLQTGDLFVSDDGQWVAVEEVYDTSEYETVYNLRIADFHTYFVGSGEWGFSVWAHNACTGKQVQNAAGVRNRQAKLSYRQAAYLASLFNKGKIKTARNYLKNIPGLGKKTRAKLESQFGGLTLSLKYKPGWSQAQKLEADNKVAFLNGQAPLTKTPAIRSSTSAAERYRKAGNTIPPNNDVDHQRDLQLGGQDVVANLSPLDTSVNRSLGSQIGHDLRSLPNGTVIGSLTIQ